MSTPEPTHSGTLGIERWVQFAYVAIFLLFFWLLDHLFANIGAFASEKMNTADMDPTLITAISVVVSLLLAFFMFRNKNINKFSYEVAHELEHVTWPSRKETWSNTLVVMFVSAISAVILGVFDAVWSAVTDLIY